MFASISALQVPQETRRANYGQWVRAEIVGAFFNAVFLIALCVSIILEAIPRFVNPPEISNPKLILIVGCAGLASNLVGFLVLGGHSHDHGPGEESFEHAHDHDAAHDHIHEAEEGRLYYGPEFDIADESGRVADVLPEAAVARAAMTPPSPALRPRVRSLTRDGTPESSERYGSRMSRGRERRRTASTRHNRLASIDDLQIHPASFRQEIIAASKSQVEELNSESDRDSTVCDEPEEAIESTPLIHKEGEDNGSPSHSRHNSGTGMDRVNNHQQTQPANGPKPVPSVVTQPVEHEDSQPRRSTSAPRGRPRSDSALHMLHNHNKPSFKEMRASGHGHSHGDMGMNAMVLHVLGDALGNIGVIVTALIIWLTDWPGRHYADPVVSLIIAAIILHSALPLTFATSRILLQATPEHIDVSDIKEDIQNLPGVVSCHHVHIWQLSDTKLVASLHVQVSFPIGAEGGGKYMQLARRVRRCLHAYGIHSATIQPEFCLNKDHDHGEDAALLMDGSGDVPDAGSNRQKRADAASSRRTGPHARSHGSSGLRNGPHEHGGRYAEQWELREEEGEESVVARDGATEMGRRRERFPGACGLTQADGDICLLEQCIDNCVSLGCCSTASTAGSSVGSKTAAQAGQGSGGSNGDGRSSHGLQARESGTIGIK